MALPAIPIIGGVLSLIGTGISSFFGFKKEQAESVKQALQTLGNINASEGQREAAIAKIIASESASGYWLSAVWRPLTMVVFLGMIVSFWLGYVPENLNNKMPPMIAELFGLMKIGIGGYIGGRTVEKIMNNMNIGKILKTYIEKRIL